MVILLLALGCKPTPEDACPDGGVVYADADGDGFGDPASGAFTCDAAGGLSHGTSDGTDCDDADATAHPGGTEVPYDGVDQDCEGGDLTDVDGDGWAPPEDCDDADASAHPYADDVPYDGKDEDCDGVDPVDVDGDGWTAVEAGGADCADGDPNVHPEATEDWYDGIDQDCDGNDDDRDGDGASWPSDCADGDPTIYPGAADVCGDGEDADCDGADEACADFRDGATTITSTGGGFTPFGAADLDGDGDDELVLGDVGTVFVVPGPIVADTSTGWTIGDAGCWSDAAESPLALGDVTGDGASDLVFTGYSYKYCYGVNGVWRLDGPIDGDRPLSDATSIASSSLTVLGAGDVTGDGLADVFTQTKVLVAPYTGTTVPYTWTYSPSSALAADVDGDGQNDFVVGSDVEKSRYAEGRGAVVFGPLPSTFDLDTDADATFTTAVPDGAAFYTLADAGDLDGDGKGDLWVGAPYADDARGVLYGWTATSGGVLEDAPYVVRGDDVDDDVGLRAPGAGDVDGDGAVDVVVQSSVLGLYLGIAPGAWTLRDATRYARPADASVEGARIVADVTDDGVDDLVVGGAVGGVATAWIVPAP